MTESTSSLSREEALYAVCLLAAFADGGASDDERKELKRIGESILPPEMHPASIYQQVLLRKVDTRRAAQGLDSPEWRQLAYEMAI
ncbi:MAG: GTPase, partial [Verrucomicrobiaceae bacterium]